MPADQGSMHTWLMSVMPRFVHAAMKVGSLRTMASMTVNCSSWIISRWSGNSVRDRIASSSRDTTSVVTPLCLLLNTLTRALRLTASPALKARTSDLAGSINSIVSNLVSVPYGAAALTMDVALRISSRVSGCSGWVIRSDATLVLEQQAT